jgi:U4/U6 small nuclear ribonucleoprotein PRP31
MAFVESKMTTMAPNMCEVVGRTCAAKLIAAAGGIDELAKMPACNIQVMGSQKRALLGQSKVGKHLYHGFFGELPIVESAPEEFKTRIVRMLSNGVAKCAKFDAGKSSQDGSLGRKIRDEIDNRFDKIQEPLEGQKPKPILAQFEEKPKRRRGGKKYRKMKERLGLTQVRQMQNRILMDPSNVI